MVSRITFGDAREIVREWIEREWGATEGTPWVSEAGYEDVLDFLVPWGAKEWLVDGDQAFLLINNLVTFVDRRNGDMRHEMMTDQFDKVEAMDSVSAD